MIIIKILLTVHYVLCYNLVKSISLSILSFWASLRYMAFQYTSPGPHFLSFFLHRFNEWQGIMID